MELCWALRDRRGEGRGDREMSGAEAVSEEPSDEEGRQYVVSRCLW